MATAELRSSLDKFAVFARSLKGDEKGEAQPFLDHFFRALGHAGVIEAGATFEFRIAKKPGSAQLELIQGDGAREGRKEIRRPALARARAHRDEVPRREAGAPLRSGLRLLDAHRPAPPALRHPLQLRRILDLRLQPAALRSRRTRVPARAV